MPGGDPLDGEADNAAAYAEATRVVLDELTDFAHVPELPERGAHASMTGRALAVVDGLAVDLQPAGWRLTDSSGLDHRRARSQLAQDLDKVEELAQGFDGVFKTQVTGPWTLAATVEKPRGDKILSDHGARRELAQALAEGIGAHVADVRRRVPAAAELVVQLDEPALPAVLAAQIPTASGWGKHRSIDAPEASTALEWVLAAVSESGATPIVHCCAPDFPIGLVRGAGARGISVDVDMLGAASYDALAEAIEAGERVLLGAVSATGELPEERRAVERVIRLLDMLGLEPTPGLTITPSCGLAGATQRQAREVLRLCQKVAAEIR